MHASWNSVSGRIAALVVRRLADTDDDGSAPHAIRSEPEDALRVEAEDLRPRIVGETRHLALDARRRVRPRTLVVGIVVRPQSGCRRGRARSAVSRPAWSSWNVAKQWRRKYVDGSSAVIGRTHMWCARYAWSIVSSSHGTKPMPDSTRPACRPGWRSNTPDAINCTSGSIVVSMEWQT